MICSDMPYYEFVKEPSRIWKKILHKSDEVAKLEGLCTRTTIGFSERVQNTVENTQEKNLVALAQSRKEMDCLVSELLEAQSKVREFLYECLEEEEADVLEWKYVNGKTIREIAEVLMIEEQSARNKVSKYDKKARKLYTGYRKV